MCHYDPGKNPTSILIDIIRAISQRNGFFFRSSMFGGLIFLELGGVNFNYLWSFLRDA